MEWQQSFVDEKKEQELSNIKKNEYAQLKYEIKNKFKIGSNVRVLKNKKLFSKSAQATYLKKIYKIIGFEENGNIIEIESENKKNFNIQGN